MSGTLTNGTVTVEWNNPAATDATWRKAKRTDLDPIIKDSVIVTTLPDADADGHPYPRIADGTRMIGISDDKDEHAPVLAFSRVEFRIFAEAIIEGQFTKFYATDAEMAAAGRTWPMWPAPEHRPRPEPAVDQNGNLRAWALPNLSGDSEGWLINADALIAFPAEPAHCPGFDCGQALIHLPMCWVCPSCHSRYPVRKSLLTL